MTLSDECNELRESRQGKAWFTVIQAQLSKNQKQKNQIQFVKLSANQSGIKGTFNIQMTVYEGGTKIKLTEY
jgi:hypothetical protein